MSFTLQELMENAGIMESINFGRKHSNSDVASCAKNLRNHMKSEVRLSRYLQLHVDACQCIHCWGLGQYRSDGMLLQAAASAGSTVGSAPAVANKGGGEAHISEDPALVPVPLTAATPSAEGTTTSIGDKEISITSE